VHEAHVARHERTDLLALEQHLQGIARLHQARHALCAAGAGEEPDLHLGQADAGGIHIRQHAEMAGERQLEGSAEAHAVYGGRERLAAGFQATVEQRELARLVEEELHRSLFALLLGEPRIFRAEPLKHGEVCAARERLLAGGDHAALDGLVGCDLFDDLFQLAHHLGGDHVHGAAGHVPGGERNAVGIGLEAEIGEVRHHVLPDPSPLPLAGRGRGWGSCRRHRGARSCTTPTRPLWGHPPRRGRD
jgi:hypothetical protein